MTGEDLWEAVGQAQEHEASEDRAAKEAAKALAMSAEDIRALWDRASKRCHDCGSSLHLTGSIGCVALEAFGPECNGGSDYD